MTRPFNWQIPIFGADDPMVWQAVKWLHQPETMPANLHWPEYWIGPIPRFGWPKGADDSTLWEFAWGGSEIAEVRRQLNEKDKE